MAFAAAGIFRVRLAGLTRTLMGAVAAAAMVVGGPMRLPTAQAGDGDAVEISTVVRLTLDETAMDLVSLPYPWLQPNVGAAFIPEHPGDERNNNQSGVGGVLRRWVDSLLQSSLMTKGVLPLAQGQLRPFLGRAAVGWGPGRFGQLTLGNSTPLDWFLLDYDRSTLRYRQGVAALDWDSDRFLLGHRLEWTWDDPSVRLGISETMTVSPGFHFNPGYLLPFTPYGLWSWLDRQTNPDQVLYANDNLGVDLQVSLPTGRLYAEVFLDDPPPLTAAPSQEDTGSVVDSLLERSAWMVGWAWESQPTDSRRGKVRQELLVEYAHSNPLVYQDANPTNSYSVRGKPLGFWLGPDSDMLVVRVGWTESRSVRLPFWVLPGYTQAEAEGLAEGTGRSAALELAVDRGEIENAVVRLAAAGGLGVEQVPIIGVATGAMGGTAASATAGASVGTAGATVPGMTEGVGAGAPGSNEDAKSIAVPATVSTYGEVRFTRQGASGSQTADVSERSVRVAVGQSLNWREMKVDIQLGVEQIANPGHRPGVQTAGLVAEVKITIPLDY